jgi:S-DNA-T family DNA segregation ATPase FtsK/SpoIIIE
MRRVVTGEELAQLQNPNPFAMPRWRAPVYRTPLGIILAVKFVKLLAWIVRMLVRHPLAASVLALATVIWLDLGWVTLVALVLAVIVMLAAWWWFWPGRSPGGSAARPGANGAPGATGAAGPRS